VQRFDRYAYVNNSPINFTDPDGHAICTDDGNCNEYSVSAEAHRFGIMFKGEWTDDQKLYVIAGVGAVADKLGQVLGKPAANAFKAVYDIGIEKLTFLMGSCEECNGAGAFTHSTHLIEYDDEDPFWGQTISDGSGYRSIALAAQMNIHGVVHELGHVFNRRLDREPEGKVPNDLLGLGGYASAPVGGDQLWVPNDFNRHPSESFANMFLGWVYGQFGSNQTGQNRTAFMAQMDGQNGWVQKSTRP
jgi:hypothetical protein